MSTYVCSDIHGCYDRFMRLLDEIRFSDKDIMYILGDVIDRNEDGIKILKYCMGKKNIILLMGNHEEFMFRYLVGLNVLGKLYDKDNLPDDLWFHPCNGGEITMHYFKNEPADMKLDILKYLSNLPLVCLLTVAGKKYHLSHSGTFANVLEKRHWKQEDVGKYTKDKILWCSPYRNDMYIPKSAYPKGYICIVGHVPVQMISKSSKILHQKNIIDVDCGCAYANDALSKIQTYLSCIRLDDMQEFYID